MATDRPRTLAFEKWHGAGNDFVVVDDRDGRFAPLERADPVAAMCRRGLGVGADGLIALRVEGGVARMVYYNADGQPSSFCGNGARCFAAFAQRAGLVGVGEDLRFEAADGAHVGRVLPDGRVRMSMRVAGGVRAHASGDDLVETGSPHLVRWVDALPAGDITADARAVRYGPAFAKTGINVNYVAEQAGGTGLAIRTYERGVEAETLACGTGVTAAALSYAARGALVGRVEVAVQARGGALRVRFWRKPDGTVREAELEGPATRLYAGELDLAALHIEAGHQTR